MDFFPFSFILLTRTYPVGPTSLLRSLLQTILWENADYAIELFSLLLEITMKIGRGRWSIPKWMPPTRQGLEKLAKVSSCTLGWRQLLVLAARLRQCRLSARAPLYFCPAIIRKAVREELGITGQTTQSCRKPGFVSCVGGRSNLLMWLPFLLQVFSKRRQSSSCSLTYGIFEHSCWA